MKQVLKSPEFSLYNLRGTL